MKNLARFNKSINSVLVVDDSEERMCWFKEKLKDANATFAMSPAKAENVIGAHNFEIVFLDHDAIPEFIDPDRDDFEEKTFFPVARMLARKQWSGTAIIHSHNPVGAKRMADMLARRAHVLIWPYGTFDIEVY